MRNNRPEMHETEQHWYGIDTLLDAPRSVIVAWFACAAALCIADTAQARHALPPGAGKIQNVIIIMQENRSFDEYFGTFPGADGIPMVNGVPTVCVPDPDLGTCVRPYHDP